jgi:hypothetical protein
MQARLPPWPFVILFLAGAAQATQLADLPVRERARYADRIVFAQILDSRTELPPDGNPRGMRTLTRILIAQNIKGSGPERIEILQLGGTYGLWAAEIPGDARFQQGEQAILLLTCPQANRCGLVGLGEGKIPVVGSSTGQDAIVRSIGKGTYFRWKITELIGELASAPADRPKSLSRAVTR